MLTVDPYIVLSANLDKDPDLFNKIIDECIRDFGFDETTEALLRLIGAEQVN